MRRGIAVLVGTGFGLASCFSPELQPGGACDPAIGCPGDLVCVVAGAGATCQRPGAVDAEDADRDDDGIANADDNCPDDANPFQHDEDADGPGDACDGCPHIAEPAPADADQDGVNDPCDPNPTAPGEQIFAFMPLTGTEVPIGWTAEPPGTWTFDGSGVARVVVPAGDAIATLTRPIPWTTDAYVAAGMTIDLFHPTGSGGRTAGVALSYDPSTSAGYVCLFDDNSMALLEVGTQTQLATDAFAANVVAGDRVDLATTRNFVVAPNWTCTRAGTGDTVTAAAPIEPTSTGVRVRGTNLQVHYIAIIGK